MKRYAFACLMLLLATITVAAQARRYEMDMGQYNNVRVLNHIDVDIDSRNAELTGLTGHFYQKDGRSAEVKADHGSYDNETKDIKIDGNVQITTSDGAELTSDELLWTAEQGMLSAIGQAKVSNDTIRAWGERIDSTDGFNKIKISGKAHIEKLMEGAEQK